MSPPPAPAAVPADRLARLRRCVNLSRWFRYPSGLIPDHFRTFITDADLDLIANLGLTGVRLTVGAEQILGAGRDGQPKRETLDCLKVALGRIARRGLTTVLAMYGVSRWIESPFRAPVFAKFWKELARELAGSDPDALLFEPANEPIFGLLPQRWRRVEAVLVDAIRAAAPDHTIVTSGANWSSLDGLLAHRPLPDRNVVYSFHFYEPYVFTHQGAPWDTGWVRELRGVPYPLTPERAAHALPADAPHRDAVLREAARVDDAGHLDRRIGAAANWGVRHGVPVWVGEFGCYPTHAPRGDVLQWFQDVRRSFERHGFGWAAWSYEENLALNRSLIDGRPAVDRGVAEALGLHVARAVSPLR